MECGDLNIDAVITWVDGDDPVHIAKRAAYSGVGEVVRRDDIGGATRFRSVGEIRFCVASILRFAPFIRRIFIVTDAQNPNLDGFVSRHFPDSRIPVIIVDHRELFRGYEQYLPTFNSLSIETMLYRIPGLSEHFVYFNDDVFLAAPVTPRDWFREDKTVCYGESFSTAAARFLRAVKPKKHGAKSFGYKDAMLNAADVLGRRSFPHIQHTPFALRRSVYESFYASHADVLEENARHRFRDASQYNPQVLFYMLAAGEGKCIMEPSRGRYVFLKPGADKKGYMERKLSEADRHRGLLFGCVNSLDAAPAEERRIFTEWIERRLGVRFDL